MGKRRSRESGAAKPEARRPHMPGYGVLAAHQGTGLLPWSWAAERLERSHNYWLATTRPDGVSHLMAVWGVWIDSALCFSTGGLSRKARNLEHDPRCVVSTESAREAVIVEGVADLTTDPDLLARLPIAYQEKYAIPYPEDSHVYAVRPRVVFGLIEDASRFTGSATRWEFPAP